MTRLDVTTVPHRLYYVERDLVQRQAAEIERLRTLLVRWLNGGDATLAQDSRDAINPRS